MANSCHERARPIVGLDCPNLGDVYLVSVYVGNFFNQHVADLEQSLAELGQTLSKYTFTCCLARITSFWPKSIKHSTTFRKCWPTSAGFGRCSTSLGEVALDVLRPFEFLMCLGASESEETFFTSSFRVYHIAERVVHARPLVHVHAIMRSTCSCLREAGLFRVHALVCVSGTGRVGVP